MQAAVGVGVLVGELAVVGEDERRVQDRRRRAVDRRRQGALDADLRGARSLTSDSAASRDHSRSWSSAGAFCVSWCCGMAAVTSGGLPARTGSRPSGIVGQTVSALIGDGVLTVRAQVVEAVREPRADVPDDLARQPVAALRALGPERRAALLAQPVPGAGLQRRRGARVVRAVGEEHRHARELSARHGDARVERQRTVEQHGARPAVRLGEHQRARERHALPETDEQDRAIGVALRLEPREEPGGGRREARRVGGARVGSGTTGKPLSPRIGPRTAMYVTGPWGSHGAISTIECSRCRCRAGGRRAVPTGVSPPSGRP